MPLKETSVSSFFFSFCSITNTNCITTSVYSLLFFYVVIVVHMIIILCVPSFPSFSSFFCCQMCVGIHACHILFLFFFSTHNACKTSHTQLVRLFLFVVLLWLLVVCRPVISFSVLCWLIFFPLFCLFFSR